MRVLLKSLLHTAWKMPHVTLHQEVQGAQPSQIILIGPEGDFTQMKLP